MTPMATDGAIARSREIERTGDLNGVLISGFNHGWTPMDTDECIRDRRHCADPPPNTYKPMAPKR